MVTITKAPAGKKRTARISSLLYKKTAASAVLLLLLWLGFRQVALFASVARLSERDGAGAGPSKSSAAAAGGAVDGNGPLRKTPRDGRDREERQPPDAAAASRPGPGAAAVAAGLAALARLVPLSQAEAVEARFLAAARRECVPGRDDAAGEINPTTRRKRECLRHVPLGRKDGDAADAGAELAGRVRRQRPRIGILVPPGFVARGFADWAARALEATAGGAGHGVQVLVTSRVPVYGYGKSHGFTKLVRFAALPAALAAYDAALWGASASPPLSVLEEARDGGDSDASGPDSAVLRDALHGTEPPSIDTIGMALMLMLRWHCRLSHVSAHTAMITLSLEDVIKDPVDALARMLGFVWKEDWEWEGHGGKEHPPLGPGPEKSWTREAEALVGDRPTDGGAGAWHTLLERTSHVVRATTAAARADASFAKAIQGAFASEMQRSSDLASWPCPSFWEGVETGGDGGDAGRDRALRRLAAEMVPACRDDDPFARCTVKKDRCEVRRDAACR